MLNGFEKPHVVAVPFPALGHAIPLLEYCNLLASYGLAVTFVTTAANAPSLKLQMAHAISSGFDIRLTVLPTPQVEGLPKGVESFEQVPSEQTDLIFDLVANLEHPFNRWLEGQLEGREAPVCIMHDVLLGWNMELAQKQNIVKVAFDTYGAFALTLLRSAWLSYSHNALKEEDDSFVLSLGLPTPLRLHKHEIHSVMFQAMPMKRTGRIHSAIQGWGMLVNMFEELEPEYLQHLRNLTGKKVWSIGPVLPSACFEGAVRVSTQGKMADISEDKLLQWLDSQSSCSVAYISFGSRTFLTEEQSKALAGGLEASEQPFIWAIKVSPEVKHTQSDLARTYLPEGFQERTKNRGLLIWGWVPQLVILSHSSVGAFMSHCRWNSMLESVTLGVPLITWPMIADQHFNSKLAVESGIGIQVCEHIDGIADKERVKEGVTLVLSKDKGKQMKRQAEKLKDMARKAVACGGSSNANLQDFVTDIQKLQKARTAAREQSLKAPKDHCVPKFI
ncbi:hypothetical protein SUGI_0073620 [Cryptomeria japonica]|uniref:scopoletin glucosyltransferase n=1 Tax=Cryptomeria japonica TaxID=3369 RepID=UPI002408E846|nr:scopoletin glucosyltransferase [Cryptomeria japonica]GLJ07753.1 hypothetical protein SUGI_0073620 [Cryptomeria japonica]